MINLINIKSILIISICTAGTLFLMSSCSENDSTDSREAAEKKNIEKQRSDGSSVHVKNDSDVKFLMDAAEMQLEEISLGKLARKKGNSPRVKELGKKMEETHSNAFAELRTLAQSKSVSIPMRMTNDSKKVYDKLDKKSGSDFDQAYCEMMVENHEDAVELFEIASTESENSEIRNWASRKIPALRAHLGQAEACKSMVK